MCHPQPPDDPSLRPQATGTTHPNLAPDFEEEGVDSFSVVTKVILNAL